MMNKQFQEWIESELNNRGWRPADLANKAGLSQTALSNVLNGHRNPGPAFCRAVAKALVVSPESVFRLADILPPIPDNEIREEKILYALNQLSSTAQDLAIAAVEGMIKGDKKK